MAKRTSGERRSDLAVVRAGMGVVVPLSDVRPSVSRSDDFSGALIRRGLDGDRIALELAGALGATYLGKRWEKVGGEWKSLDVELPDWRTRMLAIVQIIKVRGWEFAVERLQEGGVSRDILMIVRNLTINGKGLSEASVEELSDRHRADVAAGLIEEAQVEGDGDV